MRSTSTGTAATTTSRPGSAEPPRRRPRQRGGRASTGTSIATYDAVPRRGSAATRSTWSPARSSADRVGVGDAHRQRDPAGVARHQRGRDEPDVGHRLARAHRRRERAADGARRTSDGRDVGGVAAHGQVVADESTVPEARSWAATVTATVGAGRGSGGVHAREHRDRRAERGQWTASCQHRTAHGRRTQARRRPDGNGGGRRSGASPDGRRCRRGPSGLSTGSARRSTPPAVLEPPSSRTAWRARRRRRRAVEDEPEDEPSEDAPEVASSRGGESPDRRGRCCVTRSGVDELVCGCRCGRSRTP